LLLRRRHCAASSHALVDHPFEMIDTVNSWTAPALHLPLRFPAFLRFFHSDALRIANECSVGVMLLWQSIREQYALQGEGNLYRAEQNTVNKHH
jgi:hypothetical protein